MDTNANIIFGAMVDESMTGEIAITVIATGFPSDNDVFSNKEKNVVTVGEAIRAASALADEIPRVKLPPKTRPAEAPAARKAAPAPVVRTPPPRVVQRQPVVEPEYDDEEVFDEDAEEYVEEEEPEEEYRSPPPPPARTATARPPPPRDVKRQDDDVPDFMSKLRRKK